MYSLIRIRLKWLAVALVTAAGATPVRTHGQALTMDGASGVFFAPVANVVPGPAKRWNHPTLSYHMVDAGPVAGDYINVSVEEGYSNWLEVGYTRGNHTDGGDPSYSPLFNFAGMNIFNAKVKVVAENNRGHRWLPALAIGGVLRTNVPYVSQYFAGKNRTNGDAYGVATKVVPLGRRLAILLNAGVRGTNAAVYGYGGNATHWQARAFGAIGFPFPIKGFIVSPTLEVDQEPHHLDYVPQASLPTTLIYAVRFSRAPDARWSIDIGTGRVANAIAPGIDLKINHAIAIAFDRRF